MTRIYEQKVISRKADTLLSGRINREVCENGNHVNYTPNIYTNYRRKKKDEEEPNRRVRTTCDTCYNRETIDSEDEAVDRSADFETSVSFMV